VTWPGSRPVPVYVSGNQIWPTKRIRAGRTVEIDVVIKRPGWNAWLTGHMQTLHLSLTTPSSQLLDQFVTVSSGPLHLRFASPVAVVASGASPGSLHRQILTASQSVVSVARTAPAGSVWVAGAPRQWETAPPSLVSWFPSGTATTAVASPAPGTQIRPNTRITLTFSKPVSQALGGSMPPISPSTTQGSWQTLNSHTIVFRPEGYGYGLAAHVAVGLPGGVNVVGGRAAWTVPPGSTLRLQQLLAELGYLPVQFTDSVAHTAAAQEAAAIHPPAGSFTWRWSNVPSALRNMWQPGTSGEMTKGAVMAFENDHNITPDGDPGPMTWRALLAAAISGRGSTFGYTFVTVSEATPESISVWHSGHTVVSGPANTGIPQAPTVKGTFAVFEHAPSVTMSGTNPDGSHYSDPGVPWVSYFNGGDALHGFLRASYGSAQSLGCVEMPYDEAHRVYPYTPIGTLVQVT
jgi:L,D-transpeptidase catalytic domain/Putative peptidoglycan binding domain